MKKLFAFLLTVISLINIVQPVFAYNGEVYADSVILYQPDTKSVLYEKNSQKAHLVASTTKIMTALVVLENAAPDEIVEIKGEYTGIEGSSMNLKPGQRFTVKELLYGLLLVSGNDAATALACHVSGSASEFAKLMNIKARQLGCKNTSFSNPHGLDAGDHYSCAYDLALIMTAAMENDIFCEITQTKEISFAGQTLRNHNKLLWNCKGVSGGKTGYTKAAGRALVSACEREGMRLICVTLNDRNDWTDHSRIYDWGYETYALRNSEYVFDIPVISGEKNFVKVKSIEFPVLEKKDEEQEVIYNIPRFLYAPINYGDKIGVVNIITDEKIRQFNVFAAETVAVDETVPLSIWEQLKWSWYYYNEHSGCIPYLPRY